MIATKLTNLLDLRNNLGKYLDNLKSTPLTITKRGKIQGVLITQELAKEFLEWKEKQYLKEVYYNYKPQFQKLGKNFLDKKPLPVDPDEIVNLLQND
jgi:prevent-host-death family protein